MIDCWPELKDRSTAGSPLHSVFIDIGWLLFRFAAYLRIIFQVWYFKFRDLTTQLLECVHETMMQASDLLQNGIGLTSYQKKQPQQPAAVGFALIFPCLELAALDLEDFKALPTFFEPARPPFDLG